MMNAAPDHSAQRPPRSAPTRHDLADHAPVRPPAGSDRLGPVDRIFLYRHRGGGLPSVMQGVWRTDTPVPAALLASIHDELARGRLGCRVVVPRLPGARPRLVPAAASRPLHYRSEPLPDDDVVAWADTQAETPVDPVRGAGWSMAAAPAPGGGTVVSLVVSHALADARGLIATVTEALAPTDASRAADRTHSDLRDAAGVVGRVARGLRRIRFGDAPGRDKPPGRTVRGRARTAIVDIDVDAWDERARQSGATPNSLFVTVAAGIATRAGFGGDVRVAVPMAVGPTSAGDANGITVAEVVVAPHEDPRRVRAATRDAYTARPDGPPRGIPAEALHLLPGRLSARVTGGAGELDVLASNIGTTPTVLESLGPHRTTGFAARAMHPGLSAGGARTSTRLAGYLVRCGDRYTLSLVALDDDLFPTVDTLVATVHGELAAHGLTGRRW